MGGDIQISLIPYATSVCKYLPEKEFIILNTLVKAFRFYINHPPNLEDNLI